LFEAKYEGIIDAVPPPEVYIGSIHKHMQNNKRKQAANKYGNDLLNKY
jgi:hypothetical protein